MACGIQLPSRDDATGEGNIERGLRTVGGRYCKCARPHVKEKGLYVRVATMNDTDVIRLRVGSAPTRRHTRAA